MNVYFSNFFNFPICESCVCFFRSKSSFCDYRKKPW